MIKNELPKTELKTSDFHYDLPESFIAQTPAKPRDSSRLMVIDRVSGVNTHHVFRDITEYIKPGDTLVINDTRVIPARIIGRRIFRASDAKRLSADESLPVELLLLRQRENDVWDALSGPGKRAKPGDILEFGHGEMTARVLEIIEGGQRRVKFSIDKAKCQSVYDALHLLGSMPLPPYITKKLENPEAYQTVYSRTEGSAAAPTAGLHFTNELLGKIKAMGCAVVPVLLHVGLGTFRPVKEDDIASHEMHSEYICVERESADIINERRQSGGRVIAVGTTSCRTLESCSDENGLLHPYTGETGIFIYPGYRFKITDALITNFHLPESTLLMLVSAFAGRERMLSAYEQAKASGYRFFSFGDACLIL